MKTLAFLCMTFIKSDRYHFGISLSCKYGKIYNIKCLFLSQMFTISGIHVIHIHELKIVMAIKPPSLWAFQVVQMSTMTNWISFCHTPSHQVSRDCIAWQPRRGIILRSTVRTSDISSFSLTLLLQNGSQTNIWIGFAQQTASEKAISSVLAANKLCQSTAGYMSFETN